MLRKVSSYDATNSCRRYALHLMSKHTHLSFLNRDRRASAVPVQWQGVMF